MLLSVQAEGNDSNEPNSAEGMGNTAKQKRSAESHAAELAPEAGESITESELTPPEGLPAVRAAEPPSEAADSSSNSSISPQPLLRLDTGMPHDQEEQGLPWETAPAGQAPAADALEGEPRQKVKKSRHKPASQQITSKASTRKPPKQDRDGRDEDQPSLSASELQRAAQQGKKALPRSVKAPAVTPHAQLMHVPAKDPTHWPTLAESRPQKPSQCGLGFQQRLRSQACRSSPQHETLQTRPSSIAPEKAHVATQQMPRSGNHPGSSSHEQVRFCLHRVCLQ